METINEQSGRCSEIDTVTNEFGEFYLREDRATDAAAFI